MLIALDTSQINLSSPETTVLSTYLHSTRQPIGKVDVNSGREGRLTYAHAASVLLQYQAAPQFRLP